MLAGGRGNRREQGPRAHSYLLARDVVVPRYRAKPTDAPRRRVQGGMLVRATGETVPWPSMRSILECRFASSGPSGVVVAGRVAHLGSRKQRAVLAVLALHAGKVVSSEKLLELLWEEDQPASATATMQSLISRLRGTLATAASDLADGDRLVIGTPDRGWVLDVEPDCVDALRFRFQT